MTERYILEAIQKGVIAAVAASTLVPTSVKYVGRNFTPPDETSWLEVVWIPNDVQDEFWGTDCKTYQGIFRLILHTPMNDAGSYTQMDLLRAIGSYFSKGTRLSDPANNVVVKILDHPTFMGIMEEAPNQMMPLSIRYQFFKAA